MKHNYFKNIKEAAVTLSKGLKLTLRHMIDARHVSKTVSVSDEQYFEEFDKGIATLQYPHDTIPVPDNGRYRLHNEIDDCIVCDKCAKVCPVDCIDIEGIKATEVIGKTSDGTSKRIHAAKFDIDMAKCCFCGLCTTVCPTECLTMTKAYDFSEFDFKDHTYSFATMTPLEILEKRKMLEEAEKNKASAVSGSEIKKVTKPQGTSAESQKEENRSKPVFKPKIKLPSKPIVKPAIPGDPAQSNAKKNKPKQVKPKIKGMAKPVIKPKSGTPSSEETKPKMKPVIKPKAASEEKQVPKKIKPVVRRKKEEDD
ncbi:4Fe-4S dicluster domain-containing protein [Fulvivirga sp. M361]|uniref:4Fe-4S binding protein n=1 Tax=Fulvivirga sp. M361 TaxID=2594266 RepID=UPI00117A611A|nr:4Fe-4S binding protein [Fulvivirga sp. M361]TRX56088.1 4Fe-4S dicluster domain-containing protein [Fulvivirga sp. M361]